MKPPKLKLQSVVRLWDHAPHNAFTDLIRHQGRWYCAFREASAHISLDGVIRILSSPDALHWQSHTVLHQPGADLRDPTFSITPTGELMICCALMHPPIARPVFRSRVYHSSDGHHWQPSDGIAADNDWLWRVNWHQGQALGLAYGCDEDQHVSLLTSGDGRRFLPLVPRLQSAHFPTESALAFDGDTAVCLLRRDGHRATALLGTAAPPFVDWQWRDLRRRIGGPQLIISKEGHWLAAVRLHDRRVRTAVCHVDSRRARLVELLTLPSGGDCSYPGMVQDEQRLWISYYSSHEGRTAIYLACAELRLA